MLNVVPRFTITDRKPACDLSWKHVGEDVTFSFIDTESKLVTTVMGELRNIYHTADQTTLSLTPIHTLNYDYKEFAELPLETEICFVLVAQEERN